MSRKVKPCVTHALHPEATTPVCTHFLVCLRRARRLPHAGCTSSALAVASWASCWCRWASPGTFLWLLGEAARPPAVLSTAESPQLLTGHPSLLDAARLWARIPTASGREPEALAVVRGVCSFSLSLWLAHRGGGDVDTNMSATRALPYLRMFLQHAFPRSGVTLSKGVF